MSDPGHAFQDAFSELILTLGNLPFPYCLLGALALGVWGTPRTTQDIDLLIAVREQERDHLIRTLSSQDFLLDQQWADENPMIRDFHLRFRRGPIPVDLMLPRDAHDQAALSRRSKHTMEGLPVWGISAEDLILHKLKAGRAQDFIDVLSVLHRQRASLDQAYLTSWAQQLGIQEELSYCGNQLASS